MNACPVCGGLLIYLGQLGRKIHYRCRDCSLGCSQDVADTYDDPDIWDQLEEAAPDAGRGQR
jgi:hypothetical protein